MRDTPSGVSRNSIRLRRVILLRSDIRLSAECYSLREFRANRISLSPKDLISLSQCENITLTLVSISLTDKKKEKTRN